METTDKTAGIPANSETNAAPPVEEPTVEFKVISDRDAMTIVNEELGQVMVEISGYDLKIDLNMAYINTIEEVEAACEGISQLFRETIMEILLSGKKQSS